VRTSYCEKHPGERSFAMKSATKNVPFDINNMFNKTFDLYGAATASRSLYFYILELPDM
jgi:hypothetical protein